MRLISSKAARGFFGYGASGTIRPREEARRCGDALRAPGNFIEVNLCLRNTLAKSRCGRASFGRHWSRQFSLPRVKVPQCGPGRFNNAKRIRQSADGKYDNDSSARKLHHARTEKYFNPDNSRTPDAP